MNLGMLYASNRHVVWSKAVLLMELDAMKTHIAPVERVEKQQLRSQVKSVSISPAMDTLLQAASGLMLVINSQRQVVALNKTFLDAFGIVDPEKALGLRFGEVLHCKYALNEPDGCGTTPYCSSCGAVIAMMAAIDDNRACERICALSTEKKGQAKDVCLLVKSQPVVADGSRWILVYVQDISQQQHWANLDNEFMHDLSNMLCSVKNYGVYLDEQAAADEISHKLKLLADRAFREVKLQNKLQHQNHIYSLANMEPVRLRSIRSLVFSVVLHRTVMTGKSIVEDGPVEDLSLSTDAVLVSRVIINMLLNALEATEIGGTVTLRTIVDESQITWQVSNKAHIPDHLQLRIFQKYFSTRPDLGRGHGTHVMKLLGENCLGGKVSFVSSVEDGTIFSFTLPMQ